VAEPPALNGWLGQLPEKKVAVFELRRAHAFRATSKANRSISPTSLIEKSTLTLVLVVSGMTGTYSSATPGTGNYVPVDPAGEMVTLVLG
jgi:hypothetical protein